MRFAKPDFRGRMLRIMFREKLEKEKVRCYSKIHHKEETRNNASQSPRERKRAELMKKEAAKKLTRTAVLLALLVILQAVTKAGGQFVTGSCVNCVLAVGALLLPLSYGILLAVVSPFLAFLLGIGPQLLPIVPAIAVGNVIYVLLLHLTAAKREKLPAKAIGLAAAAVCKFGALFLLVTRLLCSLLSLPEKQARLFQTMFSWPQLVTAVIGGVLAFAVTAVLRKAKTENG